MIVVHYTAMSSLQDSLSTFKPLILPAGRTDIAGHGDVNVGIHYVVARDGILYRLLPETVMGRHTIGFNWCAIGIEMTAKNEGELTEAELSSTAGLVAWIASRHPSIKYLIGHHEYMKKELPHFSLYRESDPSYTPTVKIDPGDAFMRNLRAKLAGEFGLNLQD
jgi:N-acetyl-anhydromuramyl-L-alanine amidase AmpD